nr:MAG TPA: hypothetical protein [Bacteriophage sp.]
MYKPIFSHLRVLKGTPNLGHPLFFYQTTSLF